MLGSTPLSASLSSLHPEAIYMRKLWKVYRENVDPLTKIFHVPTVQKIVDVAATDPSAIGQDEETLLFATYSCAMMSLTDEDSRTMLGEGRAPLLSRYQLATRQALMRANFLRSSDTVVLQAFILFLVRSLPRSSSEFALISIQFSVRSDYDIHSLWMLTGVAVRIGLRIGLHRDGTALNLPPFETEMRRRLWWQTLILDNRTTELAGAGFLNSSPQWDTITPLNVNDSDLDPAMKELPEARVGATDMLFCSVRFSFHTVFRKIGVANPSSDGDSQISSSIAEKDRAVDELENLLETKYLRYLDLLKPFHLQTAGLARAALCLVRLQIHHPRQYADNGASLPQEEKDMLFHLSLKIIEYDNLAHSNPSTRGFLWHTNVFMQWHALIYILSELRTRTTGDDAERAWDQLQELCEHRSEIITEYKKPLHAAIGNLILKAWAGHEMEAARNGERHGPSPNFIYQLRLQRTPAKSSPPTTATMRSVATSIFGEGEFTPQQATDTTMKDSSNVFSDMLDPSFDFESFPLDPSPIDWAEWDALNQFT